MISFVDSVGDVVAFAVRYGGWKEVTVIRYFKFIHTRSQAEVDNDSLADK